MELNINKEAVKSMSKKEFVDMMQHHKGDINLEAEYDKIVPTKKATPKEVAKEKTE